MLIDAVPRSDMLIVAGDWNARPGQGDNNTSHILGKFAVGNQCANGERMVELAAANHLVISSTRFQHPQKHLVTWHSNDGVTANQIDHVLVSSRWASCVLDCRAYQGAETGSLNGSDHALVRSKLRLRLKSKKTHSTTATLDVSKLKCPAFMEDFRLRLRNRFDGLLESDISAASSNNLWQTFKTKLRETAMSTLGKSRRKRKDWISHRTIELSDQAAKARSSRCPSFRTLRRMATRSARDDRNRYWCEVATDMERAAAANDSRKLFQLLKTATGSHTCAGKVLLNDDGSLATTVEEQLVKWSSHFENLLNHEPPTLPPAEFQPTTVYDSNIDPPSVQEIINVIRRLRNNKSPGEDGLPAEVYKACPEVLAHQLQLIFAKVWESEVVPQDWQDALVLPLFKKGDHRLCTNYRGISLIDTAAKIFTVILLQRFQAQRDERTRVNQSGFRRARGCADQLFTIRRVLEQRWAHQQTTVVCFIDFKAAFDSVDRGSLWKIMATDGVPDKLLRLLQAYYYSTRSKIRCQGSEGNFFPIHSGVRQGCALSPTLFNFTIDWIMEKALSEFPGVDVGREFSLTDLDFADDVAIIGSCHADIQEAIHAIDQHAQRLGMKINATKTKLLSSAIPVTLRTPVLLNGVALEEVDEFKYLGALVTATGQAKAEIHARINRARSAFWRLQQRLWSRSEVRLAVKVRIYQALVRTVLLYGCETWSVRVEDQRRLEVFDHGCLRHMIKARHIERISNEAVRKRCRISALREVLVTRRLRWFGHCVRRPEGELIRAAVAPTALTGWRKRLGGQLKTWETTIRQDLEPISGPLVHGLRRWKRDWLVISSAAAQDRRYWSAATRDAAKSLVEAGQIHPG